MTDERAPWAAPVRALAAYLAERGEQITRARSVSDRRGSTAWQVVADNGLYALKANTEGDHSERDKRAELDREARVIAELDRLAAIPSGYLVGAGHWEAGRWLAVTWAPGAPMWNALAPARHDADPRTRRLLITCARSMASAGAALHTTGWVHADIQPTNTLVTEDGTATLIDYALACGPVTPGRPDLETDRVPYRGGSHTHHGSGNRPSRAGQFRDRAHPRRSGIRCMGTGRVAVLVLDGAAACALSRAERPATRKIAGYRRGNHS